MSSHLQISTVFSGRVALLSQDNCILQIHRWHPLQSAHTREGQLHGCSNANFCQEGGGHSERAFVLSYQELPALSRKHCPSPEVKIFQIIREFPTV